MVRCAFFVVLTLAIVGGQVGVSYAGVLDQQQIARHPELKEARIELIDDDMQGLAQTWVAGMDGYLEKVDLILQCSDTPGMVHFEVQPNPATWGLSYQPPLGSHDVLASSLVDPTYPSSPSWAIVSIPFTGVPQVAGERYAILVSADDGVECGWLMGPGGDPYAPSDAYTFRFTGGDPGIGIVGLIDPPADGARDLTFRTWIRTPGSTSSPCEFVGAAGVSNDWVPRHAPICACLRDANLAFAGCRFVIPEGFFQARIPLPFAKAPNLFWGVRALPLERGISAISIDWEAIGEGWVQAEPLFFEGRLRPGRVRTKRGFFEADPELEWTLMRIAVETQAGPAEYEFEVFLGQANGLPDPQEDLQ